MKNIIKKFLSILIVISLLVGGYSPAYSYEEPEKPEKPAKPDKPSEPSQPGIPELPDEPLKPGEEPPPDETQQTQTFVEPEGVNSNGNTNGDTTIITGDAINDAGIQNQANTNLAGTGGDGGGSGTSGVTNEGNGSGSTNTGTLNNTTNNTTDQTNSANIISNLDSASVTGENSASRNTGGDSTIITGDANATGTIITAANTNAAGATVAEFNIVDDHMGDYVLDFQANCVVGCSPDTLLAQNLNNGDSSQNSATVNNETNNTTNQTNDGTVTNNMDLLADSGSNLTSRNTNGDSSITTGDANVVANAMTLLNNNLAGNVVLGVVNIFGDLIGDIILPEGALDWLACFTCGTDINAINSGNGDGSQNTTEVNNTTNNLFNQYNDALIQNNINVDSNTGENSTSRNTGGDSSITTGDASLDINVLNIANTNLIGGNWWLVIVNESGNWIGKLFGAPDGMNMWGSGQTEFIVDENGEITAKNVGNGTDSINAATVNNETNNIVNQTNDAVVTNNLNLTANTGRNSADRNTGGSSSIITGDAEVIANLINFVNNNIVGGKLLVTMVNVFGSWTGDFLTPGAQKDSSNVLAQGSGGSSNNNGSSNSGSSDSSSSSSSNPGVITQVAAAVFNSAGTTFFGAGDNSSSSKESEVAVAGASDEDKGLIALGGEEDDVITINLAYVLLFGFMGGAFILIRKLKKSKSFLPQEN